MLSCTGSSSTAVTPRGLLIDHHQAARHAGSGIGVARRVLVADGVSKHLRPECDGPAQCPRIGVEQELGGITAHPPSRIVGTRRPVTVCLPRPNPRHEGMPDAGVVVPHGNLRLGACLVKQAEHHSVGGTGCHREVRPCIGDRRAQREVASGERAGGRHGGGGHGAVSRSTSLTISPTERTSPWRRRMMSAMIPVQPVWWKAPMAAPLSPWKYSLKIRLSCQAGLVCRSSVPPKQGRRPSGPRVKIEISRSCRSAATLSRVSLVPDPVGYSMVKSSPKNR